MNRLLAALIFILLAAPASAQDFDKGKAAYEREDYANALRELHPLAERGHANAQFYLGQMYLAGLGVQENESEGIKLVRSAAEKGTVDAQFYLGGFYESGLFVRKNRPEAMRWYLRAAEQGHVNAQDALEEMYDPSKRLERYRQAAEEGDINVQSLLGGIYSLGMYGVSKDNVQAYMWYSIAAENGDRSAIPSEQMMSREMTPEQIAEAQRMAREWLEAHPPLTQAKPQITEIERLKQMIRQQIEPCWNPPIGAQGAEDLAITIFIRVNRRGFVREARVIDAERMAFNTYVQAAADAARRAVLNPHCQPFELPQSRYDLWKEIRFTFDPRDMLN